MMQPLKFLVKCGPSTKLHQIVITERGTIRLPSHKRGQENAYVELYAIAALCGGSTEAIEASVPVCFRLRDEWNRSFIKHGLPSAKDMDAFNTYLSTAKPTWYVERLLEKQAERCSPPDWQLVMLAIWRRAKEAKERCR